MSPSVIYVARKLARRHRVALATVFTFAAVLFAGGAINIRQNMVASRDRVVAEAVIDFLQTDVLAQASTARQVELKSRRSKNTNIEADRDLKVRTALDRAAARIADKFARQPEVEAAIRGTIGRTYDDLGVYPEARKQLQRALELQRRVLGSDDPKTLKTRNDLGHIARAEGDFAVAF